VAPKNFLALSEADCQQLFSGQLTGWFRGGEPIFLDDGAGNGSGRRAVVFPRQA
jgi:hypothetical protein